MSAKSRWCRRCLSVGWMMILLTAWETTPAQQENGANQLRAAFDEKRAALAEPIFHRPMLLESSETSSLAQVQIMAPIDFSHAAVRAGLSSADQWCQMLILHLNNKHCHSAANSGMTNLLLQVASRYDQPPKDAFPLTFVYQVAASQTDYMKVVMTAKNGPMGTHDYKIMLEAVPLPDGHSLLRFSYAYEFGTMARLGMQAYSATAASNKVGFTQVAGAGGSTQLVGGLRGIVERNAMRYFLAIEAYLGGMSTPTPQQYEKRLASWFALTEQYPRQLHETDLDRYLATKRSERETALASK